VKLVQRHAGRGASTQPSAALSKALGCAAMCFPDGGDWLLMRPDGVLEQDVRITLKTDDGAFIYVRYAGIRYGPPEVMARLAQGETVDPSEYYFRVAPVFETGAERYTWLNKILAVGVGERLPPNVVRYSIFEIL
jgi:hypothetical protein